MKLGYLAIFTTTNARKVTMGDVVRNIGGNYLEGLGIERGYTYGTEESLNGLAMMSTFLDSSNIVTQRSETIEAFELTISDFLERFTNYGCYCWIVGPMRGVIGGGQTRDNIDSICGDLYKCYKCLNIDFGSRGQFSKFIFKILY